MEEYTTLINFVANLILTFSFTAFIIFIFGRPNSKLNTMPWYKTFLVKFGLCFCTAGALLNALSFSNPSLTQLILNCGLAIVFLGLLIFID
jgi:drug/metabolite transporter (DMT)-like permease